MTDLFSGASLVERAKALFAELDAIPLADRVDTINSIRKALHERSPFRGEPVDCVLWVKAETVAGNDYNPNTVAPPEMRLLETSIKADGYTQPIVACHDPKGASEWTVVDGYHRHRVGRESPTVRNRLGGYLPITAIKVDRDGISDRMAATIRHNRARGVHGVVPMTDIVSALIKAGWSDEQVAKELGMDADEVLRFKQVSGLPELFSGHQYSRAWE